MAVVLPSQVVDVARPDQRPPHLARDLHDPLVGLILRRHAVLLDLEVHVVGTECLHQLIGVGPGLALPSLEQVLAETRLKAPRQHDDALGMRGHLGHVDGRLAALITLEEAVRAQLDQIAVAGRSGGEQRQVKPVKPSRCPAHVIVDHVHFAAEDRLDVVPPRRREQLDGPVHHAVVGQRDRRLLERRGSRDQRVDVARAVEQRVLGVDMQVDAGRRRQIKRSGIRGTGVRARP